MQDVINWLESDCDYSEGLALLKAQTPKSPILLVLQTGESTYNTLRLKRELEQLIQDWSSKPEPSKAVPPPSPSPTIPQSPNYSGRHKPIGHYPPQLHPAYERLMKLYAMVDILHPRLEVLWDTDRKKCAENVRSLVDAWDEIKGIYRILDYWTENKRVLPNDYEEHPNVLPTTAGDLLRRKNNLRTYISKHRKNPKKTIEVEEWKVELAAIEAKLTYEQ